MNGVRISFANPIFLGGVILELYVDTQKMKNCSSEIYDNINSLKKIYDEMFERIQKMPYKTREWIGPAAENYVIAIGREKTEFYAYLNDLKEYAEFLNDAANDYENMASKIRR